MLTPENLAEIENHHQRYINQGAVVSAGQLSDSTTIIRLIADLREQEKRMEIAVEALQHIFDDKAFPRNKALNALKQLRGGVGG